MFKINITAQLKKMKIKNLNFKNFAVAILAIIFASCSSSENATDNTPTTTQYILPRKVTSGSNVTIANYNGNKLIEFVNSPLEKEVTTYTGDFITKQEKFSNGLSTRIENYTYEGGKLKTYYRKNANSDFEYTTTYTHNTSDISFTLKIKDITVTTPNSEVISNTGQIFITNGNISKIINNTKNLPVNETRTTTSTYEYDNKNNFLLNILGFNLLINQSISSSVNNVVKSTFLFESSLNGVAQPSSTSVETVTLAYNSNNYPIERQQFFSSSSDPKIFIEY